MNNPFKPSKKQLEFLKWEMGAFFHFGIRTFYEGHRDWDGKIMPIEGFNPTKLDCEQWIKTVHDAGFKYAILVCKHHDGFANWPSKYSDYHIGMTPYKDGQGDVVADFVAACRKYDIKVGLYYSPAEAEFKNRDAKEYDDYFIAQISELLGNYGKVDYLWFDGNGSGDHKFDHERIIKAIRDLQDDLLIFSLWDPNTVWVGNEGGAAGINNSCVAPEFKPAVSTDESQNSHAGSKFLPTECDFMMRYRNWFYSEYDVHTVKSLEELVGLYYHSVGCGSNFLVNVGPDRRGLLPEIDARRLVEFGQTIKARFANPIPSELKEMDEEKVVIKLNHEQFVNHVIIEEDMTEGEMVQDFLVYIKSGIIYRPVCVYSGKTIGNKRIITFPPIKATEIILKITKSRGKATIGKPEAFYIR
ncbi:MAG: alpha-L-fucosidase [Oscillospiraceae bacterium]|nr:alpha-L-fucosidase [Oscillospiraceae bacterium]